MDELRADYAGVLRKSSEVAQDLKFPVGAMHLVIEETVHAGACTPVKLSVNHYSTTRVRFLTWQWRTQR